MDLISFVKCLPMDWVLAPIYRKGAKMLSGKEATGKNPVEEAHKRSLNRDDAALIIENNSSVGAVGLFTGPKGNGIVILDVDFQLSTYRKKWGNTLDGAPVVRSTKANAAKFLFRVPEELWRDVAGFGLCEQRGRGYEALWNRQGLIYGEYPGSKDGKAPAGHYHFEGDPDSIPEAPGWLLAEMRAAKAPTTFVKNRSALDVSDRSEDDIAVIIQECTNVIPHEGVGSREHWLKVGMSIHSVLPNDLGLTLWSAWSAKDPEYHDHWVDGNPCEGQWSSFKPGGIGLGTLIWMADAVDPQRRRFSDTSKDIIESAESRIVQLTRNTYIKGTELLKRAKELEETIENPAELDQEKHLLALEAGRRDTSAIDRLLDADLSYQRTGAGGPKAVHELDSTAFEYLIPGLLPKPWTLLVHADGGTGKSAMCQTIAKHIAKGLPFNIHGGLVEVPKGKVLWLNGDQNERILRRQFMMIGADENIDVIGEWDMQWYRRFCKYQKENKYDLVVIDSLDGCNDANPYEENRREFALPIKRLARRNGQDFPACSIVIIHHNTKEGKFRGTSAIKAAVDETWNMKRATQNQIVEFGLAPQSRIVEVEKSRDDREGQNLIFHLKYDFTYQIGHMKRVATGVQTPNDHTLDMLDVMREDGEPWCVSKLVDLDDLGGKHRKRAIRYGLQRLEQQKLIERCDPPEGVPLKGRPEVYYRATGTNAPKKFIKGEVDSTHRNSVSKADRVVRDCSELDNEVLSKGGFVKSEGSSTPSNAFSTEVESGTFDNETFDKTPFVNQRPVPDRLEAFDEDPSVTKAIDQDIWNN